MPAQCILAVKIFFHLVVFTEVYNALSNAEEPLDSLSNDAIRVKYESFGLPELVPRTMNSGFFAANKTLHEDSISQFHDERDPENNHISFHYNVNESLQDSVGRQLWEYDNESDPVNDPFNVNFHGYQNSSVNVTPYMVDLLKGIYDVRLAEGAANPLCFNEKLMQMAHDHIIDIVDQELMLSHIGTDGSGSGDRIVRSGYNYITYGATITKTGCTDSDCAIVNRPLYFTKKSEFQHFGIAREENDNKGDPRWYWVFGESDDDVCMGTQENRLEWPAGTSTLPPEPPKPEPPPIDPNDGAELVGDRAMALLALMNAERMQAGVGPLCFNKKLMLAAQRHNQDMADNDFFSHTGSDNSSPMSRATDVGYDKFNFMSENIAGPGMNTIRGAMFYWMSSTGNHAFNILDPAGMHLGIAYDEGKKLYTAVFGGYMDDSEHCISSIYCEGSKSYMTSDPDWESYSCSLCLARRPVSEFGIMGCGFGRDWYMQDHVSQEDYERRQM